MLALLARLQAFSITDMPLFFLIFYGACGVMLYRFWRTMFGAEAAFCFAVPLNAGKQIACRLSIFAAESICVGVLLTATLLLQGEEVCGLLLSLSASKTALLALMIAISLFLLAVGCAFALTLGNLPIFRRRRALWCAAFVLGLFALDRLTAPLLSSLPNRVLEIGMQTAPTAQADMAPIGFSFSLRRLMLELIAAAGGAWLMVLLTKRYMRLE